MITNTTNHSLIASAYLSSASQIARQGRDWAGDEGQLPYAQCLATIAVAEAILAVAQELRDGLTTTRHET
jgi:hypothetical protein